MIQWWVIITIGCLPVEEQIHLQQDPTAEECLIPTKMLEAPVFDRAKAEEIVDRAKIDIPNELPGSFVIARFEKRVIEEPKKEEE